MTGYRLAQGGSAIDRSRPLAFTFDHGPLTGLAGDTLASALLAGGRRIVGRSFKYHRPRGVFAAGVEEPNALVALRSGARTEPNTPATVVELYEGLEAHSQNCWPALGFDLAAVNGLFAPLLSAGFYYKTFMGPTRRAWMLYEHFIRKAAGLGRAVMAADPDHYDKLHAFCDVLVVGSGPAGLMAATVAADAGIRVILAEQAPRLGGRLDLEDADIDGRPAGAWAEARIADLESRPDVTVLRRTTVYGYYDDDVLGAVERVADHLPVPPDGLPRQRHWTIHAKAVVLASGALERPLVFQGNDQPGVMLADAALAYAKRYGVAVGRSLVVATNNDSGLAAAAELTAAGVGVAQVVDSRPRRPSPLAERLDALGIPYHDGHVVVAAHGRRGVHSVELAPYDAASGQLAGPSVLRGADGVLVAGGWTPTVHLASQAGGPPVFSDAIQAFVPGAPSRRWVAAGAMAGRFGLADCLADGIRAGVEALAAIGLTAPAVAVPATDATPPAADWIQPLWEVPSREAHAKKFVDLQHDVTVDDVRLAAREGFSAVEHLKRYTTLGMAGDQGKSSNVNGLAVMAAARGVTVPEVGTTRFRPPYTPVAIGALAGHEVGPNFRPPRLTPMHPWHVQARADFLPAGDWLRPQAYRRPGESITDAYIREARAVRERVGLVDVSTLGKIEVQGPDAATFLDRIYANTMSTLAVGKARYGAMLREDGLVFDDGTVWRLGPTRFLVTTTTANAGPVMVHLERFLAVEWPDLKVHVVSVTEQWAGIAVSGPVSRALLADVVEGVDMAGTAFPFMAIRHGHIEGVPVMLCRLSFSGELAYEVYMPAHFGLGVWERLWAAGQAHGIVAYGLEALGTLRIEKGHAAGGELNGQTTLDDLGLGRMASTKKPFVGSAMLGRPALVDPDRLQLVGLVARDGQPLKGGAQLVADEQLQLPATSLGHVTATTYSPALEKNIALALLAGGRRRHGQRLWAADPLRGTHVPVEVVAPCFFDPEGTRLHG